MTFIVLRVGVRPVAIAWRMAGSAASRAVAPAAAVVAVGRARARAGGRARGQADGRQGGRAGGWGQQGQVGAAARCTPVQQRLELRSILDQVREEAVNAKAE